jgi:hypothetical protein
MIKDYMQREEEVRKQPDAYKTFEKVAQGNLPVYMFLVAFWNFEHVFDDLMDNSDWDEERKEQAWKALHDFTCSLLLNPFVKQYASELKALFSSAIARQIGGDHIVRDEKRKQHAACTRCADIDILVHIAGLHQGWDAMVEFSKQRDIDKE